VPFDSKWCLTLSGVGVFVCFGCSSMFEEQSTQGVIVMAILLQMIYGAEKMTLALVHSSPLSQITKNCVAWIAYDQRSPKENIFLQ